MTRKDYQAVALSLASTRANMLHNHKVQLETLDEVTEALAAQFAMYNDNFKKDQFLEAACHGFKDSDD